MPRGDKSKYTDKQKRQAEHIERGYEQHGVPEGEAERRAWATVNKVHHGGEKPGTTRPCAEAAATATRNADVGAVPAIGLPASR